MCTVSAIGDNWKQIFPQKYPETSNTIFWPAGPPANNPIIIHKDHTTEIEALKKELADLRLEMKELRELLLAAKKFDEATGQPDCEVDEKVILIKKIAELVGVDMSEVFK